MNPYCDLLFINPTHETSVSTNSFILAFLFSVALNIFSSCSICLSIEICFSRGSTVFFASWDFCTQRLSY